MYHRFKWTGVSHRRNSLTAEYEPLQPYVLLALAQGLGCRTFVDVGANIGAYSVLMSQVPSVERIIAFEPNPHAAAEIRRNFAANSISGIVREAVVTETHGSARFGTVSRFAGNSAVVATSAGQQFHSISDMPAVTLDKELAGCPEPLIMKIDVEGHEHQVIAGAKAILTTSRCVLQIENFAAGAGASLPEEYRVLTHIGPDWYFTNIPNVDAADVYQRAAAAMIEANHERKSVALQRGDFSLEISGRSYELLRHVARKFVGSRL